MQNLFAEDVFSMLCAIKNANITNAALPAALNAKYQKFLFKRATATWSSVMLNAAATDNSNEDKPFLSDMIPLL